MTSRLNVAVALVAGVVAVRVQSAVAALASLAMLRECGGDDRMASVQFAGTPAERR